MTRALLYIKPAWRIAKIVFILGIVLWVSLDCFLHVTRVQIDSVFFDESSEWNKYFLAKTGFSTICIRSYVASRKYTDHISIVGSTRPRTWFEQLGFEDIDDDKNGFVHTITKTLPGDGSPQPVMTMAHSMMPRKIFFYLPTAGILIYHDP